MENPALDTIPHQTTLRWPAFFYGLIALIGCLFAFIGLSSNSYWADELYTMQVVNHRGGLGEVFRRVLADVHPPLYDFVLYGWIQLAGIGESATRLPSAVFAVLAILVFALGARRRLTPTAIAFACAVATTSTFWFVQSQNARDYALAALISSALLAAAIHLHRRIRADSHFPVSAWLWLTVLGIAGSQTHPYMLLTVGMVLLFLLVTARTWPLRLALCASGAVVLGLYVGLLWLMTHTSVHDFHGTWFSNRPKFLASQLHRTVFNLMDRQSALVVVTMLLALWLSRAQRNVPMQERDSSETRWTTRLCWCVFVGVIVSGMAVSLLLAASFSYRNVLVCAPFGWFLIARLYDAAGPRTDTRAGTVFAALAVILVGSQLFVLMRGRLLPTNEPWRASAAYVQSLPNCGQMALPVVIFANSYGDAHLPVVHNMVERNYFGYYLPPSYRLHAYLPDELMQRFASSVSANEALSNPCPFIAWGIHDMADEKTALALAQQLASTPGLSNHQIVLQEFVAYQLHWLSWKPEPSAFVFLFATPTTMDVPANVPNAAPIDQKHSLGDRLLITDITMPQRAPANAVTYSIQRWRAGKYLGETRMTTPMTQAAIGSTLPSASGQ